MVKDGQQKAAVKLDPELADLVDNMSRIRGTQSGGLVLELNKHSKKSGWVEKVLGEHHPR